MKLKQIILCLTVSAFCPPKNDDTFTSTQTSPLNNQGASTSTQTNPLSNDNTFTSAEISPRNGITYWSISCNYDCQNPKTEDKTQEIRAKAVENKISIAGLETLDRLHKANAGTNRILKSNEWFLIISNGENIPPRIDFFPTNKPPMRAQCHAIWELILPKLDATEITYISKISNENLQLSKSRYLQDKSNRDKLIDFFKNSAKAERRLAQKIDQYFIASFLPIVFAGFSSANKIWQFWSEPKMSLVIFIFSCLIFVQAAFLLGTDLKYNAPKGIVTFIDEHICPMFICMCQTNKNKPQSTPNANQSQNSSYIPPSSASVEIPNQENNDSTYTPSSSQNTLPAPISNTLPANSSSTDTAPPASDYKPLANDYRKS